MATELILIDGHYHIYKSFFAFGARPLTNNEGERVEAAYAITTLLWGLVKNRNPDAYWAIAMDGAGPTFRHEAYEPYKATRETMPDELRTQFPWIETILQGFRIPVLRVPGYEADDLIATVATRAAADGMKVTIQSKDKDLEQILSDRIHLLREPRDKVLYGPEELLEKRGIRPEQVIDYQALIGDSSDNIPGVKGIGPKTAVKILEVLDQAGVGVGRLLEDPPLEGINPKTLTKIREHADDLRISRELVTLAQDAPAPVPDETFAIGLPDPEVLTGIFQKLGFRKYLTELPELVGSAGAASEYADDPLFSQDFGVGDEPRDASTPEFATIDSHRGLSEWMESVEAGTPLWFATYPVGDDPLETAPSGVAFAVPDSERPVAIVPRQDGEALGDFWSRVGPALGANRQLRGHDLKYHARALGEFGLSLPPLDFDIMLAAYLIHSIGGNFSLDLLAAERLGRTLPSAASKDPGVAATRLAAARDLEPVLSKEIARLELGVVLDLETKLLPVLIAMEAEGISLDLDRLKELEKELSAEADQLEARVYEAAGTEFTIGSPKQLQEILFERLGLPPGKKTKTGYSTSADVLEELSVSHPEQPLPGLILEHRSLTKLLNTYITALPLLVRKPTGRLHTDLRQAVAATGRLASNKPNLQNIPVKTEVGRRVRRAFVPNHSESLFLSADYSQIELRLMAHLSGDPELKRSMIDGADIHRTVAARIHGKKPEDVTREERTAAKAVNFGVIYGMGAFGLARDLGISRADAKKFIDAFFENFSRVKEFIDETIEAAHASLEVRTILGRRRPLPELASRSNRDRRQGERFAVNTVVQGSAADLIKKAMVDVHSTIREKGSPARMLLQIHDELLFEVPSQNLEETESLVREAMEEVLVLDVPLVVNVSSGEDWYDASK